jgi:acyl carrier protein
LKWQRGHSDFVVYDLARHAKLEFKKANRVNQDPTAKRILTHMRRITGLKQIDLDRPFKEYGIDSITSMELLMDVEREFNINIPEEKMEELVTAKAIISLVQTLLALQVR